MYPSSNNPLFENELLVSNYYRLQLFATTTTNKTLTEVSLVVVKKCMRNQFHPVVCSLWLPTKFCIYQISHHYCISI